VVGDAATHLEVVAARGHEALLSGFHLLSRYDSHPETSQIGKPSYRTGPLRQQAVGNQGEVTLTSQGALFVLKFDVS
jgi:hypothetical protein